MCIESSIYKHNSYTESQGIVFEFNHYGPLRAGCPGNNLKDRSTGTVIRYNWIEGGNWLPLDWRQTHESGLEPGASVSNLGNVEGTDPGFEGLADQEFHLAADAQARDAAGELPDATADYLPDDQYGIHQRVEERPVDGGMDIGAFEYAAP